MPRYTYIHMFFYVYSAKCKPQTRACPKTADAQPSPLPPPEGKVMRRPGRPKRRRGQASPAESVPVAVTRPKLLATKQQQGGQPHSKRATFYKWTYCAPETLFIMPAPPMKQTRSGSLTDRRGLIVACWAGLREGRVSCIHEPPTLYRTPPGFEPLRVFACEVFLSAMNAFYTVVHAYWYVACNRERYREWNWGLRALFEPPLWPAIAYGNRGSVAPFKIPEFQNCGGFPLTISGRDSKGAGKP